MALRDWIIRDYGVATATIATVATARTVKPASVAVVATVAVADRQSHIFDHEAFAERTAIIQANGIPEAWATGYATLCTMPRPTAYIPERWQQIVNDGGRFLDQWGRQAAALGWNGTDVFGVDPANPETAYRSMGLVPLLSGRPLCAITADIARIDCGNGVTQSYRRTPVESDATVLWKLQQWDTK